jgi:hypothetical protein
MPWLKNEANLGNTRRENEAKAAANGVRTTSPFPFKIAPSRGPLAAFLLGISPAGFPGKAGRLGSFFLAMIPSMDDR